MSSTHNELTAFLSSLSNEALVRFCVERLSATESLPNRIAYARAEAAILRKRAAEIEARAAGQVADEMLAEWTDAEVKLAMRTALRAG